MFLYAVLLLSLFHLFALSRVLRRRKCLDENTKVLMYLSMGIAVSVPVLGLLGPTWPVTVGILAAAGLIYLLRRLIVRRFKRPIATWLRRYHVVGPYPCLAVSIVGLLSWAWFHP